MIFSLADAPAIRYCALVPITKANLPGRSPRRAKPAGCAKILFSSVNGTFLKLPTQHCAAPPWDFRSEEFRAAALILVQTTGCSLMLCRQELFIAEGDMEQAHAVLVGATAVAAGREPLH